MNLSKKIALNTLVQVVSKTISVGLGLVSIGIMTRYLGQIGFGEYTTVITFLSFFAVAADLGLTLVTVQMISQANVDENQILSNLFSLRLFSALLILLLAPLTIFFFPYSHAIKIGVTIAAASFLFTALNQVFVGLFQKNLRLDKISIAEVVSRIILVLGIMLTAYFNLGLNGILVTSVLSSLISFLLHYFFARQLASISINFNFNIWLDILKKSWPIGLTIVFNLIYLRADTLILSLYKSQAEVGIYGAAYKVIDVLITVPFIFAGIILPILTASWTTDQVRFKKVLQKAFDLMAIIALPLFFGTEFLAKKIMVLVAGQDFIESGSVLKILIGASAIIFLGTMFSHAIIALDKQRTIIWSYVFTALTALLGYLIFIPKYSYYGAAWVTIYSELVIALAAIFIVWKYSNFLPNLQVFFKALLASLIMSGLLYYLKNLNLAVLIISSVVCYSAILYLIKGIDREDLINLVSKS